MYENAPEGKMMLPREIRRQRCFWYVPNGGALLPPTNREVFTSRHNPPMVPSDR